MEQMITPKSESPVDIKPRQNVNILRELVAERIVSIETKHEQVIANLKHDHAEVVANLKHDHAEVVANLKHDHAEVVANLEADHADVVHKLKKKNQGLRLQRSRVEKKHESVVKKMDKQKQCAENTRRHFAVELSYKKNQFKRKVESAAESVRVANKKVCCVAPVHHFLDHHCPRPPGCPIAPPPPLHLGTIMSARHFTGHQNG